MTAHSRLGASNAHRWMNCTASVAEEAKWPNESNPAADRGTVNHYVLELCLRDSKPARHFIGRKFVILDGDAVELCEVPDGTKYGTIWEFTEEDEEAVQVGVDAVADILESMTEDERERAEVILEEKLDLSDVHPDMFGTADILILIPFEKFWMLDYKNGTGLVEVEGNAQVLYYSTGVYLNHGTGNGRAGIIQPNAYHNQGPVRHTPVDETLLESFIRQLKRAANEVDENPTHRVGPWCHFCRANKNNACSHKMAEDHNESMALLTDLTGASVETSLSMFLPPVGEMTNEQLSVVVSNGSKLTAWVASAKTEALKRAKDGGEIPGYVVGEGRKGARAWVDEDAALDALTDAGVPFSQISKLKTPTDVEKLVGKKDFKKFADFITQKPGSPSQVDHKDAEGESADPLALLSINDNSGNQ